MNDQTCIHCSQPLSKHFRVERVDDVLAPPVLICPVCTFLRPDDNDGKAPSNEVVAQAGIA